MYRHFILIFLHRCQKNEDVIGILTQMRKDYSEFRSLRLTFADQIASAHSLSEKQHIVDEWNRSWKSLMANEFDKPQFLKRKISSVDISSVVLSPESSGIKTILRNYLDHREFKKSFNHFRVFSDMNEEIGNIQSNVSLLEKAFGIKDILRLPKNITK